MTGRESNAMIPGDRNENPSLDAAPKPSGITAYPIPRCNPFDQPGVDLTHTEPNASGEE